MRKLIFVIFSLATFNLMAAELQNDDAKALAEQLRLSINSTVSKILELEKQSSSDNKLIEFELRNDEDDLQELGLVLTSKGRVIAVTPNSLADKFGFQSGDHLRKVTADELELNFSKPIQLQVGSRFVASVDRAGEIIELEGDVEAKKYNWHLKVTASEQSKQKNLENNNACGRVTIFARPPETKGLYPVLFNQANGKNLGQGRNSIRLAPGHHKIKVNELIHARGMTIRRPFMVKGKIIEIDVEANKTYYLAAEFDSSKRLKSKGEEYWKPIVWKVTDRECKL